MRPVQEGMFARSLAGHDKGKLYVIVRVEEPYMYIWRTGKNPPAGAAEEKEADACTDRLSADRDFIRSGNP